jgi:hypothetical protein
VAYTEQTRQPARGETRTLYLASAGDNLQPQTPEELADMLREPVNKSGLKHIIALVLEAEQRRYSGSFYDQALRSLGFQVSNGAIFLECPIRVLVYQRQMPP